MNATTAVSAFRLCAVTGFFVDAEAVSADNDIDGDYESGNDFFSDNADPADYPEVVEEEYSDHRFKNLNRWHYFI